MFRPYHTVTLPAAKLFAAGASFAGARFTDKLPGWPSRQLVVDPAQTFLHDGDAISLHDLSTFRAMMAYFDDDVEGIPLVGNRVIRRKFRAVSFAPLFPATYMQGVLPVPGGTGTLPVARQVLVVNIYKGDVPQLVELSKQFTVYQSLYTAQSGGGFLPLLFLHAPGLRSVSAWASNGNTAFPVGAVAQIVSVYGLRPERADGANNPTDHSPPADFNGALINTITVGTSADKYGEVELGTIQFPNTYEFVITIDSANSQSYNIPLQVGFRGEWL